MRGATGSTLSRGRPFADKISWIIFGVRALRAYTYLACERERDRAVHARRIPAGSFASLVISFLLRETPRNSPCRSIEYAVRKVREAAAAAAAVHRRRRRLSPAPNSANPVIFRTFKYAYMPGNIRVHRIRTRALTSYLRMHTRPETQII